MSYRFLLALIVTALFLQACSPPEQSRPSQANQAPATATDSQQTDGQSTDSNWYLSSGDQAGNIDVLKSPADTRDYRFIILDNGLKVLLISDPDTDKAAASLSIDVGSFENPKDRDGLAHFLEHMLFLGTDKFPEPGEYQAYLSAHGGTFNAYTSLEETNYFFDVDAQHLLPTLDRFSRFFVAPLFNPEYVDRERHAVDSEYQLKIKDDSRREWDVLRELANPEHPFSRFSVGSLDTLANTPENPVREDLLAFYEKYYSATEMNLVVLGKESLDELQQAVSARFKEVPAHEVMLEETDTALFSKKLPFSVNIRPEKELRHLSFNFPLPSVAQHWQQKPIEFLGHLIGHEGEGSLLANLKQQNLAEGLSAGLVFDSRHGALFSVQINLTPQGVEQQEQITTAFFHWLELIKTQGIEPWRYEEVASLGKQSFRFAEKQPPMTYVQRLSTDLHLYNPGDILRGNHLFDSFDAAEITRFAAKLNANNVAIVLTAPEVDTEQKSLLYGAPYRVAEIDASALSGSDNQEIGPLALPNKNPYIAQHLDILTVPSAVEKPFKIGDQNNLWYYPDSQFNSPKGYFEARVTLPQMTTIERSVMTDYLVALTLDQLSAETYPAMLAGLGFNLASWEQGFTITISGYSEKQQLLLERIIQTLNKPDWSRERLNRVQDSLLRKWRNSSKEWPLRQLFNRLPPLVKNDWLPLAKADALEKITPQQLQQFQQQLSNSGKGRFYAGGNFSAAQAQTMAATLTTGLGLTNHDLKVTQEVKNLVRSAPLPSTSYYVDHNDSAALLYLQGDQDSLEERATFSLLSNILSAPFYSSLRTEKQLGYAVGSTIAPMQRVPGQLFYVQSPKVDAETLKKEINHFLDDATTLIASLSDEDLQRYRQSVLAQIEEKPRNINELAARHLESLNLGYENFDFRPRLVAALNAIDRETLTQAFARVMVGERAGLWILTSPDKAVGSGEPLAEEYLEPTFSYDS